jgi:hypothetical protein
MFVFQVHHYIKAEFIETHKAATLENARATILEPGVIRSTFSKTLKIQLILVCLRSIRMKMRDLHILILNIS